jgi:hypothetical protein
MAFEKLDPNDAESAKRMRAFFSPQQVDQQIRQAIGTDRRLPSHIFNAFDGHQPNWS